MAPSASFGALVKERRTAIGLTQAELGRRVGCAPITIRKIESNALRPSVQVAEHLAVALGVREVDQAAFVRFARVEPPPSSIPDPPPNREEVGLEDLSGRAIRGFSLGERLGLGAFGVVYRAVQTTVGREVAVKIISPAVADQPEFVRRFEVEAQTIAGLEHPYIVPLYDYWREPGGAFLVMRLMRGGSLKSRLAAGPLAPPEALRVIEQVGSALHVSHRSGVIHRDIKPANILLDEDQNAYLADFGIARHIDEELGERTQEGAIVGSPAYFAPEQIRAEPVRPQTDIYSLGIVLYELIAGRRPFQGPTPVAYIQQHLSEPLPPLGPGPGGPLDAVIARATAKDPAERYPDLPGLLADLRRALGVAPPAQAIGSPAAGDHGAGTEEIDLPDLESPYKGLRAFGEADAADFFGRDQLVQDILARLSESGDLSRFLTVVGPSGSGKSSVVRAGLVPALRAGGVPGSERWFITDMLPGSSPIEELEAALLRIAVRRPAAPLIDLLRADDRGLLRAAAAILPPDPAVEALLVIDQLEEVFTLVEQEGQRAAFLDLIVTAVLDPQSRVRVVVTLRADFTDQPLRYIDIGELMRQRSEFVLPLSPDELEQAIVRPTARAGLRLEPGLAATIIREVGAQPGVLPLLQHALSELFERRQGRTLTLTAYRVIGGVSGALARRADAILRDLEPPDQDLARQLFLRLTTPGEGTEDTRRRALRSELASLGPGVDGVIELFGRHRLLSFDRDPRSRGPTVEVAHEALLREWGQLRRWLAESRADLRQQRMLALAAAEWQAAGRDESFLLRGARLAQLVEWSGSTRVALASDERELLESSLARHAAEVNAEDARRARELETARQLAETEARRAAESSRAAGRLRRFAYGLAGLLSLAITLAAFAFVQRDIAQRSFERAEAQRLATEANTLIAESGNIDVATLLAIRSIQAQYSPQGDKALSAALQQLYPRYRVGGNSLGIRRFDISADSRLAAAINADGSVRVWQLHDGAEVVRFQAHSDLGADLRFLPDGRLLTGGHDGRLLIWDLADAALLREIRQGSYIRAVEASPDGSMLFSGGEQDPRVFFWDAATGAQIRSVVADELAVLSLDVSPDGRWLAVGGFDKRARLIEIASGAVVHELRGHTDWIYDVSFTPDGASLITAGPDLSIRVWDVATGQELRQIRGHTQEIWDTDLSADGRLLITAAFDGTARLWDMASGQELQRLNAHNNYVSAVAISADGRYVLTNGVDNWETALMWDLQQLPEPRPLRGHASIVPALAVAHGGLVASGSYDTTVRLWDLERAEQLRAFEGHGTTIVTVAISPDGRYLLSGGFDRATRLWDTATGEERVIARHPKAEGVIGVAFSPDGSRALSAGFFDQTAYMIDLQSGAVIWELHDPAVGAPAFSPDGSLLLMIGTPSCCDTSIQGGVAIFDAATGAKLLDYPIPALQPFSRPAFAPDGQSFAVSGAHDIYLWQVGDPASRRDLSGHTHSVIGVAYSPDGRYLLSGSWDGTARLWDVASGQELRRINVAGSGGVNGVAFAPDGRRFLTAHDDGLIRVWHLDIGETVAALCARLLRDLSAAERVQYGIADDTPTCPGR